MKYAIIPSYTHATQTFTHLEQGPNELLDDYLNHVSGLLSKMYHTSDMSSISAKGTNHYEVMCGLNCRKLKDSVAGQRSAQRKMMEECFRDIHNINVGCEGAKGYCRAEFSMPYVYVSMNSKL